MSTVPRDQIEPTDVLCCKSSFAFSHAGNRTFRELVRKYRAEYQTAQKEAKIFYIQQIVSAILRINGRFLKPRDRSANIKSGATYWTTLSEEQRHSKVAHALRSGKRESKSLKDTATATAIPSLRHLNMTGIVQTLKMPDSGRKVSCEQGRPRSFDFFMSRQRSLLASMGERLEEVVSQQASTEPGTTDGAPLPLLFDEPTNLPPSLEGLDVFFASHRLPGC